MLALARALELDAVAEGIETGDQADRLRELNCGYAQGYLYGRPAPATSDSTQAPPPQRALTSEAPER